jgi:hypothetical protein
MSKHPLDELRDRLKYHATSAVVHLEPSDIRAMLALVDQAIRERNVPLGHNPFGRPGVG